MPGMNLDSTWREAKAGTSMTDGESYVVQFQGPAGTVILARDIEGAGPPASDEDALVHFNRSRADDGELEFEARAGWTWWLKTTGGASRLVTAEI